MTKDMSTEEKEIFIEDIPDKNSIGPRLYDHRQNFIPKRPTDFVSKVNLSNSLIFTYGNEYD